MVDLQVSLEGPTPILTDSQSAIAIAKNPMFHARTKYIEVHYHYVKEGSHAREFPAHENVANIFTKALPREKFETFCKALNLSPFGD